tara:strand:- start:27 stop:188 length:162 start_codon:yes stop_codon:yes gene_type:complete
MSEVNLKEYEKRVNELEAKGLTRSDAQGVVDAEDLLRKRINKFYDEAITSPLI